MDLLACWGYVQPKAEGRTKNGWEGRERQAKEGKGKGREGKGKGRRGEKMIEEREGMIKKSKEKGEERRIRQEQKTEGKRGGNGTKGHERIKKHRGKKIRCKRTCKRILSKKTRLSIIHSEKDILKNPQR